VLRFFNTTALVGNTAIIKHADTVQGPAQARSAMVRDRRDNLWQIPSHKAGK
jgi:uncharacterized protein YceK